MLKPDFEQGELPSFPGWETIEKLGEGGMCVVFRARPVGGGPERALKMLLDRGENAIRRFVDEAALLQRIDHQNVVKVHHLDAAARPPWLVMDLLGGRDLEETMKGEGRLDPERAARLFADLANGLQAVHDAGVRHRDIKPANLRFGTDGVPRLIDFGIARDPSTARQTAKGFVVGTASYLPPEIFAEEDSHDAQDSVTADVYALGQTLCELLAGEAVHGRKEVGTEASLLVRIMRDKLDRPWLDPRDFGAAVPDGLAEVVRKATARAPADRYESAAAFERALRGWLSGRESAAMVAPVTRVDPSLLSAPERPPPVFLPAQVAPPPPPPAPSGAGKLAVGAAGVFGVAGMGAVVAGVALVALVGVGLLLAFRPAGGGAEPAAVIRRAVDAMGGELATCRPPAKAQLVLALQVRDGRADGVSVVRSSADRHTERCVTRVLQAARYPKTPPVAVEVPVEFR